MATKIPDLWAPSIRVNVLTPLMILKAQATFLKQRTQGLLQVDITTVVHKEKSLVIHSFDLLAPAAGNVRERVLMVSHRPALVYPSQLVTELLGMQGRAGPYNLLPPGIDAHWAFLAETEEEFIDLIGRALRSTACLSLIQSLLAASNETRRREEGETDIEVEALPGDNEESTSRNDSGGPPDEGESPAVDPLPTRRP